MKKMIAVFAISAFTFGFAKETPKKNCCTDMEKKECKMKDKKTAKACTMKDHKDCKGACETKKESKKVA